MIINVILLKCLTTGYMGLFQLYLIFLKNSSHC